jgi:hypothetical protein
MGDAVEALKGALNSYVQALLARARVDYMARYEAKVVQQNADGTLELQPDDARFPGMSNVRIYCGMPGVTVKVAAGARCLLEFAGGDPSRPIVTGWAPGNAVEISFNGGATPVAKEGSGTVGHTHSFSLAAPSGGGAVTGTISSATDAIKAGTGSGTVHVP